MARAPRGGRRAALERVCSGAWAGTADALEIVLQESIHTYAWRPARAAALMAAQAAPKDQVWMTAAEFSAWVERFFPVRSHGSGGIVDAVGIAPPTRKRILAGERAVTKAEALACAHYALGLPAPVPALDVEAFNAWVSARFAAPRAVSLWLEQSDAYVMNRMKGYDITAEGRVERRPSITLIRALDWIWRTGPTCPYGQRVPVAFFPGQPEDLP